MNVAGIVLAAGASTRMGQPKSLLPAPHGACLADYQAGVLRTGGCTETCIVIGSDADRIGPQLRTPCVINRDWENGRITSVQTGLRALPGFAAYVILPVDTVGIRPETIRELIRVGAAGAEALRPQQQNEAGRVLWVDGSIAQSLLELEPAPDIRLDEILAVVTGQVQVNDPGAFRNVNTPKDWEDARRYLAG